MMPATPRAMHAHRSSTQQEQTTAALLQEIVEQLKLISAALEKLASK
jgi:hypothetical protein